MKTYNEILSDVTKTATKIPQSDYLDAGKYRIFDQGKEYSVGFSNDEQGVVTDYPYIIFGDHTRVVKYVDEPCYIGADGVKLLKVINKDFDPRFVYYNILAKPIENQGYARHFKFLKEIQFTEKSLSIQIKIAAELDTIQSAIDNKKQQLALLDEAVKSKFVEMFGKPLIDNGTPFSECITINPKKTEKKDWTSEFEVSFVPMSSVGEHGEIITSETRTYDKVKSGFTYFSENDVLFAKITPCMENGKGAIAKNLKNCIGFGSTEFHVLRPIENISNPYWIYYLTSFKEFRNFAEKKMTGSAGQKRVPVSTFNQILVYLPSLDLQNQFATFVQQIDKSKFVVKQQITDLQELLDSKMQEYFGE